MGADFILFYDKEQSIVSQREGNKQQKKTTQTHQSYYPGSKVKKKMGLTFCLATTLRCFGLCKQRLGSYKQAFTKLVFYL